MRTHTNLNLKPCPFCGTIPVMDEPVGGEYMIECKNSECPTAPNVAFDTSCSVAGLHKESVVERWNTRNGEQS